MPKKWKDLDPKENPTIGSDSAKVTDGGDI